MKKKLLILLIIISVVISLAGCGSNSDPNEEVSGTPAGELSQEEKEAAYQLEEASQRTIKIGYNGGLCQAAIAVAQEKGFFEEEGLKTELTKSESPRDAIAGGKIDTSAGMIADWLKPITNGVNLVFTEGLHTGCTSAIVLADSAIESFEDAKGETVAISGGIGGYTHNIGYRMIAHDGLATDDFTWKDFPADQLLIILQNGDASVAIAGDQMAEKWVQEGLVKRIRSTTSDEDFADETCCVMGISGEFAEKNPIASEKINKAIYKASLWVEENKEKTAQILVDNAHVSGEVDYILGLLELYDFKRTNEQTEKSIGDSVREYKELKVISEDVNEETLRNQIWHPYDLSEFE